MLPLRQHVVGAVEADHGLHVGGHRIIGVAAVLRRELVGREPDEGGEMAPSGIAHQADALRVEPKIGRPGAHELDCRFHVVDAARIGAGLAEPVVDGEQRVAVAGQELPQYF